MTPEITNVSNDDQRSSIIANALLANVSQLGEWRSHLVYESSAGFLLLEFEAEECLRLEHRPEEAHVRAQASFL